MNASSSLESSQRVQSSIELNERSVVVGLRELVFDSAIADVKFGDI